MSSIFCIPNLNVYFAGSSAAVSKVLNVEIEIGNKNEFLDGLNNILNYSSKLYRYC